MNTFNVSALYVANSDSVLNVDAMVADLRKQCSAFQALQTASWDVIAPAIEEVISADPKCQTYPVSIFMTASKRAAIAKMIEDNGGNPLSLADEAALTARVELAVPEYLKANSDRFYNAKRAGIRVLQSIAQQTAGEQRYSTEEWTKHVTPKAKPTAAAPTATATPATPAAPAAVESETDESTDSSESTEA